MRAVSELPEASEDNNAAMTAKRSLRSKPGAPKTRQTDFNRSSRSEGVRGPRGVPGDSKQTLQAAASSSKTYRSRAIDAESRRAGRLGDFSLRRISAQIEATRPVKHCRLHRCRQASSRAGDIFSASIQPQRDAESRDAAPPIDANPKPREP